LTRLAFIERVDRDALILDKRGIVMMLPPPLFYSIVASSSSVSSSFCSHRIIILLSHLTVHVVAVVVEVVVVLLTIVIMSGFILLVLKCEWLQQPIGPSYQDVFPERPDPLGRLRPYSLILYGLIVTTINVLVQFVSSNRERRSIQCPCAIVFIRFLGGAAHSPTFGPAIPP
jgi:hypothetical protein